MHTSDSSLAVMRNKRMKEAGIKLPSNPGEGVAVTFLVSSGNQACRWVVNNKAELNAKPRNVCGAAPTIHVYVEGQHMPINH